MWSRPWKSLVLSQSVLFPQIGADQRNRATEISDFVRSGRGGDTVSRHQLAQTLFFPVAHLFRSIHDDSRQS